MLDLKTLKQALAPLSEVGRDESTFEVADMRVTVRPLLPLEEVAVQRYAASVLTDIQSREGLGDDDQMGRAAALDYFDRFRIEIIAYSIVQVDSLDLRNVKTIATGEVLDNGVAVQVKRTMAMREIVEGWSRAMITVCFSRYGELIQKIADQAEKVAKTSMPDLDAEITRVTERLERLKNERGMRAAGDPSVTSQQITSLLRAGEAIERQAGDAADAISMEAAGIDLDGVAPAAPEQPAPKVVPPVRKSVVPPFVPPPTSGPPVYRTTPAPQVEPPNGDEFQSSFNDGSDPNTLAAEEARIMAARAAATTALREEPTPEDSLRRAVPAGQVGGVDAYRLPSENMSPRGRNTTAEATSAGPSGTENPHFKPSSR